VDETIYVRFTFDNYGYRAGSIIPAKLLKRDVIGVHVEMRHPHGDDYLRAWSDLGSFEEITAMELIALAADGQLDSIR